jgi:alanine-glyoxylate transaminase/(R)-3-amino-2-methylpropionate-pyruvate transaminase
MRAEPAMPSQFDNDPHELELDWDTGAIVARRNRYFAASQRAFVPYQKPLIFSRGQDQYLWDDGVGRGDDEN